MTRNNRIYTLPEIQKLIHAEIERESTRLAEARPENLYLPVRYILGLEGKKLRPALVLLSYNLFSENIENALPAAVAIEIFHNFTLLHDDIMDRAAMRRNEPTVHTKFGENAAILSGDVMSFISFRYLLKSKTPRLEELLLLFSDTAVKVCEGQQYDLDFERRPDVSEEEYLNMISLKTAVLLACSLKSGALLANANEEAASGLYHFGMNLGMAFQLQDDLLDTFGDENTFGKKIGGDILSDKKTYLLIKALELAGPEEKKQLLKWMGRSGSKPKEKIHAVRSIFNQLGIEKATNEKTEDYLQMAGRYLNGVPVDEIRKKELLKLALTMAKRNY